MIKKTVLQTIGYLSVGLGFAGVFLPLLPTTPFLLLAALCFSKSSARMHDWIYQNRLLGKYLRNYQEGQGVHLDVKISTLILLWASICFTMIVCMDSWAPRLFVLLTAIVVSVHILLVKTCRMKCRTLILAATEGEIAPFRQVAPADTVIEVIGIGPQRSTANTLRLIRLYRPKRVILAGIAGAYPESGLSAGDTVLVREERMADLGSFSQGAFEAKFSESILCDHLPSESSFRAVRSNSVTAAAAPFVETQDVEIENMEGVGFFYACRMEGIPFLELRTISNRVGEPFERWEVPLAVKNLSASLLTLLHETAH